MSWRWPEDADNSATAGPAANALPQEAAVILSTGDDPAMLAGWVGMAGRGRRRFVRDEAELERWLLTAKLEACPHCGCVGALNAHGWLRGYSELGSERVVRGRRVFCSNRHRRPGCGRTFSVLLCGVLGGFVVGAETLSRFATAVLSGASRKAAWERLGKLSVHSGYRLWHRLARAQPHIRTALLGVCPPPACDDREPLAQLMAHLNQALPSAECVLSAFQLRLQRPLLP